MTQQQKLKEVVEATGGCIHESNTENTVWKYECTKCGFIWDSAISEDEINPSPLRP